MTLCAALAHLQLSASSPLAYVNCKCKCKPIALHMSQASSCTVNWWMQAVC